MKPDPIVLSFVTVTTALFQLVIAVDDATTSEHRERGLKALTAAADLAILYRQGILDDAAELTARTEPAFPLAVTP